MIYFFTPYSHEKKLLDAIDDIFSKIEVRDWAVLMDGDTMFLRSDFGQVIREYIRRYPHTGLFTCYASRCHYSCQVPRGVDMMNDSILYHKHMADAQHEKYLYQVKEINRRIAGHLMVIRKSTWVIIREQVRAEAKDKAILGVDTKISNVILKHGLKIRLMRSVYLMHYLRLKEGFEHKAHLS